MKEQHEAIQLERSVVLSPLEQRYVASCYPLPDRPGLDSCNLWKARLRQSAGDGGMVEIKAREIGMAFPHLAMLIMQGKFQGIETVQGYFESLKEGGLSHNLNLYKFAKSVGRAAKSMEKEEYAERLVPVMDHVNGCAVKPADLSGNKVWTFGGFEESGIDSHYFGNDKFCRYALVHGVNEEGLPVAVRPIDASLFAVYRNWYEGRWKSKDNPFNKQHK